MIIGDPPYITIVTIGDPLILPPSLPYCHNVHVIATTWLCSYINLFVKQTIWTGLFLQLCHYQGQNKLVYFDENSWIKINNVPNKSLQNQT